MSGQKDRIADSGQAYVTAIRRHLIEKVPLSRALREAGFSESYSRRSCNDLRKSSKPFDEAWQLVQAERRARSYEGHSEDNSAGNLRSEPEQESDRIKGIVKNKLVQNVQGGRDDGVRSAHLLGKFKEHDWWARDHDQTVGIFAVLNDPNTRGRLNSQAQALDGYQECRWCEATIGNAEELQKHSLECPKRPVLMQTQPALKEAN